MPLQIFESCWMKQGTKFRRKDSGKMQSSIHLIWPVVLRYIMFKFEFMVKIQNVGVFAYESNILILLEEFENLTTPGHTFP